MTLASDAAALVQLDAGRIHISEPIEAPRLIWLTDGARRELLAEGGTRATVVMIPALTLIRALPATPLGEQMRRTLGQDLSLPPDPNAPLIPLISGPKRERAMSEPGSDVAANHYLSILLVALWRMARTDLVAHGRAPKGLAERFVLLAGQRVREHVKIADYARKLGVSRDRLGSAVRRSTGLLPQAFLHQLLIREASELLASTGMPIGQVAFRLGFTDPAYFTRFFTHHQGESPARFRRKAKDRSATGEWSYAARS